ncbi:hypothetical protein CROQUDRAFT_37157 [Cronartium quercuum f. sp. fusiforme G11]|uniref:Laccase n=1 Tax=Cronartium quercuum f. sp. fusiforme G11 TaxID=708437 RepID=A0A9P6NSN7_9BASI|nr:hypothetical protein CROQUDRAFT_37157 [Cronartium quercuum f. sp. fusiforme G11]
MGHRAWSLTLLCCAGLVFQPETVSASVQDVRAPGKEYVLSSKFEISSTKQTRKFELRVTNTSASPDGFLRHVLAINGQIPGPLIEANEGDRLEITVINELEDPLTIHWHGLYQNGTNWEDGPSGITQCPIPPSGGKYTYIFPLDKQFGTFCNAHHDALKVDGIVGPLIIHSPRDPLKRKIDFDQEIVVLMQDWWHTMSSVIMEQLLTNQGYRGRTTAPSPSSVLMNGVGAWDCRFARTTERCQKTSPPEFNLVAGSKTRFRFINAGARAMFYMSADNHILNVTEADATPVYGPTGIQRVIFHNGQRYSVIVETPLEEAGINFFLRARMNRDCWPWISSDLQDTALAIVRVISPQSQSGTQKSNKELPTTTDWTRPTNETRMDLDPDTLVPIIPVRVPNKVAGSQTLANALGFQPIATREKVRPKSRPTPTPAALRAFRMARRLSSKRRQLKRLVSERLLPLGKNKTTPFVTDLIKTIPAPAGTEPRFYVNNVTAQVLPYQPILQDLARGGSGSVNSTRIASATFHTVDWYDLYLVNMDQGIDHPFHLHGMDMHIVATGKGSPTRENLKKLRYNTENPLRRDTVVISGGSFLVARILTDLPGVWFMVSFAAVVIVQPEKIKQFKIPERTRALCSSKK